MKKIGTWRVTYIAIHRIKHHPFRHCRSKFLTAGDNLQCTLYIALYNGRCCKNACCESQRKAGMIPYRTVCITSRGRVQCTTVYLGTVTCFVQEGSVGIPCTVYFSVKRRLQEHQYCLKSNGIPQTGVKLAYTLNPFSPSAGRVLITRSKRCNCIILIGVTWYHFYMTKGQRSVKTTLIGFAKYCRKSPIMMTTWIFHVINSWRSFSCSSTIKEVAAVISDTLATDIRATRRAPWSLCTPHVRDKGTIWWRRRW